MDSIFIVSYAKSGYYTADLKNWFFSSKADAIARYVEVRDSIGDDPTIIQLFELDTKTLEEKFIDSFEGTIDDLEDDWEG